MQNLTEDVLLEIFDILSADGYTVGDSAAPPWNLARVSRRWRQTTLSYGSLWSNMTISITRYKDLSRCRHLSLALERSGTHPLTLSLRSILPSSESDPLIHIVPALVALSKETRRWKSVKFCLPTNLTTILLVGLGGQFDCLEEIRLEKQEREFKSLHDFSQKGVGVDLSTLFLTAPRLVDVACDFDIPFQFPWAQLKTFTYHITANSMIPYIAAIPRLCPQLKKFQVQQWATEGETQGTITLPTGHFVLPHLEISNIDLEPLLDLITVPALKSITVQSTTLDDHIIPLIARSECYDLDCLVAIKHVRIDVLHLIEQPRFTKLRFLLLAGPAYDPLTIFSALRDRASLPALERISMMSFGVPHAGEHYVGCFAILKVILEVVQARELKAVTVAFWSTVCWYALQEVDRRLDTSDCVAKLEEQARDRGVELNIMFCTQNFVGLVGIPGMGHLSIT